jgi:hypothetical protein
MALDELNWNAAKLKAHLDEEIKAQEEAARKMRSRARSRH